MQEFPMSCSSGTQKHKPFTKKILRGCIGLSIPLAGPPGGSGAGELQMELLIPPPRPGVIAFRLQARCFSKLNIINPRRSSHN